MEEFLKQLASKEPVPGGGGASALIGAVSCALLSMVANLTSGKKKYIAYQERIDTIILQMEQKRKELLLDIEKDAKAFLPLSQAYALDHNAAEYDTVMEEALYNAAMAPMDIVRDIYQLVPVLEELCEIGTRIALSDVAVAAAVCKSGLQGAVMNIYVNTKSMKNRAVAEKLNQEAKKLVVDGSKRCEAVYSRIVEGYGLT